MTRPRKALVLAAGFGSRMRPLSWVVPKPLMPVWGTPGIEHGLRLLRRWGVSDCLVNVHHQADAVIRHFRNRPFQGMTIQLSFEPEILGTGGVLRRAEWFLDDQPFWMINTDIAADLSPRAMLAEYQAHHPLAVLWLDGHHGPRTVDMQGGRIRNLRSRRAGAAGTYTFCGLHLLSPRVLNWIPARGFSTIVDAYENAMRHGRRISGTTVPRAFWRELGSPAEYLRAHRDIRDAWRQKQPGACLYDARQEARQKELIRAGVRVEGFACVADDAVIKPGARLRNSVLLAGAGAGRRAVLDHAIVGPHTRVQSIVQGPALTASRTPLDPAWNRVLQALDWPPETTTLMPLAPRGSDRAFTRIERGARRLMVIHYGTERRENARYAGHARFLRAHGVPVPAVVKHFPKDRVVVMEDAGNTSLLDLAAARVRTSPGKATPPPEEAAAESCYRRVLDALLRLHRIPAGAARRLTLEPAFTAAVYRWERELLAGHLLRDRFRLRPRVITGVLKDLEAVAGLLVTAPRVLLHRDMQSSNVLFRKGKPVFVDFQGMRFGPAAYDVASLLCDPYVMLPAPAQTQWLAYYTENSPHPEAIEKFFWPAAVERLAQALGAFARLGNLPGTASFARYIRPALLMMRRALQHVKGLEQLRDVVEALSDGKPGAPPRFTRRPEEES